MSKKFEAQLNPCPFCGGRGRLRHERKNTHAVIGTSRMGMRRMIRDEHFIQCESCHARTQGRAKLDNVIDAWNRGHVYQKTTEKGALTACPSLVSISLLMEVL